MWYKIALKKLGFVISFYTSFLCLGNTGQGFPNPHGWDQKCFWSLEYLHRRSALLILEMEPESKHRILLFHLQMVHAARR